MTDHRLGLIARAMLIGSAIMVVAALMLTLAGQGAEYTGWGFRGFPSVMAIPFSVTGFVILNRLPRHGIGWAFLALGLSSSFQGLLFE